MLMRTPEFSHKILIGRKIPTYLSDLTNSATCLPKVGVLSGRGSQIRLSAQWNKTVLRKNAGQAPVRRGTRCHPESPAAPRAGAAPLCSSACLPGSLHLGYARLESREAHTTRFPSLSF